MKTFPQFTGPPRALPNTPTVTTLTAAAPTDLATISQLAELYPGLGRRMVQRIADERRCAVFRIGGRVFISGNEFAAYLASGRIESAIRP